MKRKIRQRVVEFPADPVERQRILHENEDHRLRVIMVLRKACGWLLLVSVFLFLLTNYRLFLPSSIRSMASNVVSGLQQKEGDRNMVPYENGSLHTGVLFSNGLAYMDSDTLYITRPGGLVTLSSQLSYTDGALQTAGDYLLAYDRGGTGAALAGSMAVMTQLDLPAAIISGAVSKSGNFVLIGEEQGYRTTATVFDAHGEEVFKWASPEYYIASAALSDNGKTLAAIAFRQNDVTLESHVLFFNTSKDEIQTDLVLSDSLGLRIALLSDNVAAVVCDNGLYLASTAREKATRALDYSPSEFLAFTVCDDTIVVATRAFAGTARAEIHSIRASGRVSDPLTLTEEVSGLSLSHAGLAVLTASGGAVYTDSLAPMWHNAEIVGARQLLLSDDGTLYALYSGSARLFTGRSTQSEGFS